MRMNAGSRGVCRSGMTLYCCDVIASVIFIDKVHKLSLSNAKNVFTK